MNLIDESLECVLNELGYIDAKSHPSYEQIAKELSLVIEKYSDVMARRIQNKPITPNLLDFVKYESCSSNWWLSLIPLIFNWKWFYAWRASRAVSLATKKYNRYVAMMHWQYNESRS